MSARKGVRPCDLSGADFWLEIPSLPAPVVQAAIAEALASIAGSRRVIRVRLLAAIDAAEVVVCVAHRAVGVLPSGDGQFSALAEALRTPDFAGACSALVIDRGGLYALRLDLDQAYAAASPVGQDALL
jgi:hypothetical protein